MTLDGEATRQGREQAAGEEMPAARCDPPRALHVLDAHAPGKIDEDRTTTARASASVCATIGLIRKMTMASSVRKRSAINAYRVEPAAGNAPVRQPGDQHGARNDQAQRPPRKRVRECHGGSTFLERASDS